jgi:uncharacterized damage-inducible protein DinB
MYTAESLLDLHERVHLCLVELLDHCCVLSAEELSRELPGFGYPSVRLQLHHEIGAERYWVGVLHGRIDAEENDGDYPTVASLQAFRERVSAATEEYLASATTEELNTARPMITWGGKEHTLVPAHVVLRTQTHLFHHQGQIVAMCRILGKPAPGLDFPIAGKQ